MGTCPGEAQGLELSWKGAPKHMARPGIWQQPQEGGGALVSPWPKHGAAPLEGGGDDPSAAPQDGGGRRPFPVLVLPVHVPVCFRLVLCGMPHVLVGERELVVLGLDTIPGIGRGAQEQKKQRGGNIVGGCGISSLSRRTGAPARRLRRKAGAADLQPGGPGERWDGVLPPLEMGRVVSWNGTGPPPAGGRLVSRYGAGPPLGM